MFVQYCLRRNVRSITDARQFQYFWRSNRPRRDNYLTTHWNLHRRSICKDVFDLNGTNKPIACRSDVRPNDPAHGGVRYDLEVRPVREGRLHMRKLQNICEMHRKDVRVLYKFTVSRRAIVLLASYCWPHRSSWERCQQREDRHFQDQETS